MGGGTQDDGRPTMKGVGLSPRGRGNRYSGHRTYRIRRSIPAWAGEPWCHGTDVHLSWVYPRVGGGTNSRRTATGSGGGLSPRGRGNRTSRTVYPENTGSIPAWAGEPALRKIAVALFTVYPRVGGGTSLEAWQPQSGRGLSPRGRGNPARRTQPRAPGRSIPAWAGEPQCRVVQVQVDTVYPRVGGGTWIVSEFMPRRKGLSPRGRGNPGDEPGHRAGPRSIPAWAGEPSAPHPSTAGRRVYPRVGGGT